MLKLWVNNNVRDDHKVAILAFWALFIQFVEKGNLPRDILLEAPQYKQVVFDLLNNGKTRGPLSPQELEAPQI